MQIVLASQSPSRRMILNSAGVEPLIHPAHVDEDAIIASLDGAAPADIVSALALAKAHAVAPSHQCNVVIGGDSMLLIDGHLHGKPHTETETIKRWRQQRGKTAELITGHAIIYGSQEIVETSSTTITFAEASDVDIERYAASGEPLECAGAFTLEALGGWFIDSIHGDPSSVIGLSLPVVRRALYNLGFNASDFWS
ncbi:Maf-like protein [Corynebacterium deserti GIMN1.010]|uniref:Nucleoside triphosphate pyrophosphatase n=1 Tax=Corynebacterium deserti GIMN1.010 TaxID=931089 RepID=A0A0M4CNM4_9CORY|nr:nucleoside triphosphate pyrophosphatase [Corynebacterium deserti]ALC05167.1 Maf-like protein [Corynebacterium deserti GIMN1.010]